MLDKKDKIYLRSKAQVLKPLFQIGKDGIKDSLIDTISDSLEAHELIKISLLKSAPISLQEAKIEISHLTHSEIIMSIGKVFVIYRKSKKNKMGL